MNKRNKILIGAGIVLLAGVIGTGIYMQQRGKGEDKSTELAYVTSVSSMDPSSQVQRLAGVVEPQKTWEIQKNAEREVKEILVEVGSEVEVGTALFVYDTETLEADLQQAQLDLERADTDMENLRSQIAQLEKEKKSASEDDQFSYTTQIQTAQMDLKKSEYERKSKEVEISQIHEKIANSSVTSEMQGVVKSINEGNETDPYSGSSQAFMTILATGVYRVKGKVNEQNIGAVQEGAKAIIRSRVDESKTWTGTFTAVDTENREGNNNNMMYGGGSDSGEMMSSSYPFYINLDTSDGLMLGQHVYIENDTGMEEKEGIWLDEGFIMDADKQPCVWVENKDGKLEKRDVTLGEHDENLFQYQIKSGLKVSDYIAFPQEFLKVGMKTTHEEIPMSNPESMPADGEMPEGMDGLPADGADTLPVEGEEGAAEMEGNASEGEAGSAEMEGNAPEGEAGAEGADGAAVPSPEGEAQ